MSLQNEQTSSENVFLVESENLSNDSSLETRFRFQCSAATIEGYDAERAKAIRDTPERKDVDNY